MMVKLLTIFVTCLFFKTFLAHYVRRDTDSLVVSTGESLTNEEKSVQNGGTLHPFIYSMEIYSNISNRFATTLITSRVRNPGKSSNETNFSVVLPEQAFISEFIMEIDGKSYKAYVKEKEEAKKIYDEAISRGESAGHVAVSPRDSNTFTVSVNMEPQSKIVFRLTYEELLQRQNGQYELVLNINPGQIVKHLSAQVNISETRPLTFVRTPSLRTGNEISKNSADLQPTVDVTPRPTYTVLKFNPNEAEQSEFAKNLGGDKENGMAGQFVVQYDVEQDPQGGQILVKDGYFVHFFAPSDLVPLPKQVVFVLDNSGSMGGRKMTQLVEAMRNILTNLKPDDIFNMVAFSDSASVWNLETNSFVPVKIGNTPRKYGELEPSLREMNLPNMAPATKENIEKAKSSLDFGYMGSTNIMEGLEVGLFLIKRVKEAMTQKYQPILIFLTDGQPNSGVSSTDEIINITTKLNTHNASIFGLSFGDSADKSFLRKLSLKNQGFNRHIYEAADATLQLQNFYKLISSPLMNNINFEYVDNVVDVTKTEHPIFFAGSELVVVGRTMNPETFGTVHGWTKDGMVQLKPVKVEATGPLERLWAYLTVKQILEKRDAVEDKQALTKKALDICLKYSFVTDVSSLVVVKPNSTSSVAPTTDGPRMEEHPFFPVQKSIGGFHPRQGSHRSRTYSGLPRKASGWAHSAPTLSLSPVPQFFDRTYGGNAYVPFHPHIISGQQEPINKPNVDFKDLLKLNITYPLWIRNFLENNGTFASINDGPETFNIGEPRLHLDKHIHCPNNNDSDSECSILFDCPLILEQMLDFTTYSRYACTLLGYDGVCCPKTMRNK